MSGAVSGVTKGYASAVFGRRLDAVVHGSEFLFRWREGSFCARDCVEIVLHSVQQRHGTVLATGRMKAFGRKSLTKGL